MSNLDFELSPNNVKEKQIEIDTFNPNDIKHKHVTNQRKIKLIKNKEHKSPMKVIHEHSLTPVVDIDESASCGCGGVGCTIM